MSRNPHAELLSNKSRSRGFYLFSLLFWALFLLFAETTIVGDGIHYHLFFPALFSDGNLNLADEFVAYPQGSPFALRFEMEVSGYAANPYPFGSSLLQIPFFLVAWIYDRAVGFFSESGVYDFLSTPYLVAQILSTWFYAWLGCFCLWKLLEKLFHVEKDLWLILLSIVSASPLLNYLIHDPAYSHAYSFFAVSFFYYLWFVVSRKDSIWSGLLVGSAGGLVFLVRWQDILFLLPAAVYTLGMALHGVETPAEKARWRNRLSFMVGGMLGFLVWISPQLAYWQIIYGKAILIPLGDKIFHGGGYHFQEALFSKKNGLFKWHPITLLATLGLIWMAYKKRWLWWFLPAMVFQFLFIGSLTDWTGSYAFGQRRWVSGLPIWAMGLAALFSIRWKPWRWLLRLGVVYLIVWNFFVFWAWHGGFFEGGRHSTSKVFWMIRNTPHELFGGVFDLALFPGLILDFSARRVSLFLLAWLCTTGAGLLIFASLKHCPTRRVGTLIALVPLLAPIGLVAAFFHADQTSRIVLQGNYSLDSLYPNRQIGLHPQRIGGKESFTGEVDNLMLSAHQRLQVRIKNPQPVDSLDCVAYLSSAAAGIRKGSECLRVCVSGVAGEASQTLWVGEELDFPHSEFGSINRQGGTLRPVTGELAPDGTAYFSYGNRFSFAPMVVREVTIENRLGAGEIGIEALSFSPVGLSDYPIESTREFESGHQPHTLDLASIFNGVIPYASPEIGLTPGGEVDWRGVPFHISGSAKENCLWTGFEKGALRFATPLPAIECDAVHLLIGVFTDSATRTQENIATVRLYFADGKSSVDEIIMGRDVRPPSSLYSRDSMVENWTIPVVSRNSSGLWVKTLLCPRGSAPLIGIEIARNFETKSSLVVYAATAVSSNAMKM